MAPQSIFTDAQLALFTENFPRYREEQEKGKLSEFWTYIWSKFFNEEDGEVATEDRQVQVKNWFRNHERDRKRKPEGMLLAGIKPAKQRRALTVEEQYSKLFYTEKLKKQVDEEREKRPKETHAAIRKAMTREAWQNEGDDVKQQIMTLAEQGRKQLKLRKAQENKKVVTYTPEMKAANLAGMVEQLSDTLTELERMTGWHYSLTCGGPDPNSGGRIQVYAIHRGKNGEGKNFHEVHAEVQNGYLKTFATFLHHTYRSPTANPDGKDGAAVKDLPKDATPPPLRDEMAVPEATINEKVNDSSQERIPDTAALAGAQSASQNDAGYTIPTTFLPVPTYTPQTTFQPMDAAGAILNWPTLFSSAELFEGHEGAGGFDLEEDIWTVLERQHAGLINSVQGSDAMPFTMPSLPIGPALDYTTTFSPRQSAAILANVTHPSLDDQMNAFLGGLVPNLDPKVLFPTGFPSEIGTATIGDNWHVPNTPAAALAGLAPGAEQPSTPILADTTHAAPIPPPAPVLPPAEVLVIPVVPPTVDSPPPAVLAGQPPTNTEVAKLGGRPQRERKSTNRDLVTLTCGAVDPGIPKPHRTLKKKRSAARG